MNINNIQFQQEVMATSKDLHTQIGQLVTTVNQLQRQGSDNIPTLPIINPKGNVSVDVLKSDKELPKPTNVGAKIDDSAKIDSASVDICTDLLSDVFDFYEFDLGSFDCNCDNSDESANVCNICA